MKKNFPRFAAAAMLLAFCAMAGEKAADSGAEEKKSTPKLAAEKTRIKCTVCKGKGEFKKSPPDVGQFTGKINHRSHWDVEVDPCPVCRRGWRTVWDLAQREPSAEPPCMKCGWTGLLQCRKCLASGMADCPKRGCEDGWIIEKRQTSGSRKSRKPPEVKICPECRGAAKVVCRECKGMRAKLCGKCFGTGRKL